LDRLKERQGAIVRELSRRYSTDDFESLKQLGVGAFGVVTLVRCKRTGDQFALKQIRKDAMLKKNHRDRVLAERTLLSELRTEWVVTLHRTFQDQQYLYMVMEYLPGGDFMSHLLRLDSLSEDVTRFYMAELVEAVHAVHRLGFIHRDIKPDNIVLTKSGHLKLIDFGLCKFDPSVRSDAIASDERLSRSSPGSALPAYRRLAKSSRSQLKSSVGTPQYMAPETMTKHYDHTSDFWSVGMIAYECLMGGTPFFDEDAESRPGGKQDVHRILHKVSNYKEFLQIPFPGKNISSEATSFLRGLLCDPSVRMRYDQIRSHAFFRGIGWSRLHQLTAPIVPAGEENNRPSNKSPQLPLYRPSGMKKDPNLDFVGYTFNRFC
jgi:protein-serine/threonine kinase